MTDVDLGEVAYEAYRESSSGRSLVSGVVLPGWGGQREEIREAWRAAAVAVLAMADPDEALRQERLRHALAEREVTDLRAELYRLRGEYGEQCGVTAGAVADLERMAPPPGWVLAGDGYGPELCLWRDYDDTDNGRVLLRRHQGHPDLWDWLSRVIPTRPEE